MLEDQNKRSKKLLFNLIKRRINKTPNFALFIGAGASAPSGVKTSSEMISEWRQQLYEISKSNKIFKDWVKDQDWFEDDDEYSILFEKVYDRPSQRRIYIEECVKDSEPSWGYIYLSNIITQKYFNVIFTTNFEDLINEACFIYSNLRPIVSAHDSAVSEIRITSSRPKIIKLHGDFLYDSIKNTVKETETLEKNMRDKFAQFAREYGLVVIGYGGNDKSIMDILTTMLKSEEYFPNGVYWCLRNKDKISKRLKRLMTSEKIYWVEIDGFDEFMAELHKDLKLKLPTTVSDPYKATTEKLNSFILPSIEVSNEIIKEDISSLASHIKQFTQILDKRGAQGEFDKFVPYKFLGDEEFKNGNYSSALSYYQKALLQNPQGQGIKERIAWSNIWTENFDKALDITEDIMRNRQKDFAGYLIQGNIFYYQGNNKRAIDSYNKALSFTSDRSKDRLEVLLSRSLLFLKEGKWDNSLSDVENALNCESDEYEKYLILIHKAFALKRKGKNEESKDILDEVLINVFSEYYRATAYAILGEKKNMLKELKDAIRDNIAYKVAARIDPRF